MKEAIHVWVFIGLPIWWVAQTLLTLRDYYRRRDELRRIPPPTADEIEAVTRIRAALPQKEKKSPQWSAEHLRELFGNCWWFVPVMIAFWPMALLSWALQPLEMRLSPEDLQRFQSEGP